MTKYILKRLALAFLTLFVILSITFLLMRLLPFQEPQGFISSKIAFYQDQVSLGYVIKLTEESDKFGELLWRYVDETQGAVYYYKAPLLQQYFNWIKNIFTGWNWGTSTAINPNVDAMIIIGQKLPYSLIINIFSVIIAVPFGILLGIWAALKKNKLTDHIISTAVMVFISVPSFVIISLLILWFGYDLEWLPTQWPVGTAPFGEKVLGLIIPVTCLSFGSICGYTRFTRAELCEVMSSEYLLLARTKGLTKSQAIVRHALRNAMVPIVPSIIAEFIGILSGSMILENLYGIPGIGSLFVDAINKKDYNVVMVDMAVFTSVSLCASVLLDVSYGFIDPRIRMGAKK